MVRTDRRRFLATVAGGGIAVAGCAGSPEAGGEGGTGDGRNGDSDTPTPDSGDGAEAAVETVAEGLEQPWGIAVLDGGAALVTELPGRLRRVDADGDVEEIGGVPSVQVAGQGGLLDVAVHPDYPDPPWVYLSYAAAGDGGSTTRFGRGRLAPDGDALEGFEVVHTAEPFVDSVQHYGSRLSFGPDGSLYGTVGDRRDQPLDAGHVSQDPTNELGATLRLEPDGSIPADNPFVGDDAGADTVFSYGHRNPQGMAIHPETGAIWQSEHGEGDGDEINVLEAGGNYGWPVATYACEYDSDERVGVPPRERPETVPPVHYWPCGSGGFPPAGMDFHRGDGPWSGDLFVGTLAGTYLGRFAVDGTDVTEQEPLLSDRDWRVRDVAFDPASGALLVAVDAAPAPLLRVRPA